MKLIKGTIILALIVMTYTISVDRLERKSKKTGTTTFKKKTKDEGSGSWDTGFDCPGILIAQNTADPVLEGKGKFFPKQLETSTTDKDKIGWVFEMGQIGSNLKKVFFQDGTSNRWYLPYRYMVGDFRYNNPFGDNKTLEGTVKNDLKETFRLKIKLPYKTVGWFINDEQGKQITTLLSTSRVAHQNTITNTKSMATSAASDYLTNKPLLDAASAEGSNIATAKANTLADQKRISDELKANETQLQTISNEIAALEAQLAEKRNNQATVQASMLTLNSNISALESTLQSLGTQGSSTDAQKNTMKTNLDKSLENLNLHLQKLQDEAPPRLNEINLARTAVTQLKRDDFNANLNKITPIA